MGDSSDYEELKLDALKFYRSVGSIYSPALGEKVYFTGEGFNHIVFKNSRRERDRQAQLVRFSLLPKAVKLISISTTHQEYEKLKKSSTVGYYDHKTHKVDIVTYWGLIAILNGSKIKVVLRKVGKGRLHFWSIMPKWITSRRRDSKLFRK